MQKISRRNFESIEVGWKVTYLDKLLLKPKLASDMQVSACFIQKAHQSYLILLPL